MNIQPSDFWNAYKAEIAKTPIENGQAYSLAPLWTRIAVDAAIKVIGRFNLVPQQEYYRVDAIGYEPTGRQGKHNWILRIAFEHENGTDWTDELCKLCHIVADLRVLVSYYDFNSGIGALEKTLGECLEQLEEQIRRSPGNWLFIFGPWRRSFGPDRPFIAFELRGTDLRQLEDDGSLNPADWPVPQ